MTPRFVQLARAGTIAAALWTLALAAFAATFVIDPERGILRTLVLHGYDFAIFIEIVQMTTILLSTAVLMRALTPARIFGALVISVLMILTGLGFFSVLYTEFWSPSTLACYPAGGCGPDFWEANGWAIQVAITSFVVAAALTAILNRRAPARDTALRIALLLLSALPFLTALGLAGTVALTRRDIATAAEAERELVDA